MIQNICMRLNNLRIGHNLKMKSWAAKTESFQIISDFLSGIFGGRENDCITRRCAECTTNQHCLAEKYCSNYKCVSPPNNRCNFDRSCPRNYECRYGSCQYVWSQQIRTTVRANSNTGSSIGIGSKAAIKFQPIKPVGFDNIRIV